MANPFFCFKQFTVRQDRCAMKVGTDGTLLGAWACGGRRILDAGTGTGLIALMMAQRFPDAAITGIDIDEAAVGQAQENVAASPFAQRIAIVRQDVATMEGTFDAIVSNPPYFANSLHSPDAQRTLARHASDFSYRVLMERARHLLHDDGTVSVVVPADDQRRMETEAALAGLFKFRDCAVSTSPGKPAKRHLLAFSKHPRRLETTLLTLGSPEATALTQDFYIH